jgi:hypothetical protein
MLIIIIAVIVRACILYTYISCIFRGTPNVMKFNIKTTRNVEKRYRIELLVTIIWITRYVYYIGNIQEEKMKSKNWIVKIPILYLIIRHRLLSCTRFHVFLLSPYIVSTQAHAFEICSKICSFVLFSLLKSTSRK